MHIRILGSAAGGGFPQWNCGCGNCVAVRDTAHENLRSDLNKKGFKGKPRTQVQIALSADSHSWFLAGASPDLTRQIEDSPDLRPRALRGSPVAGVVLGSADLDHILGLLLLRELQPLRVYASPSILRILREENSMFGMLNRVELQAVWTSMNSGTPFPLLSVEGKDSGLRCEALYISGRYPKYVKTDVAQLGAEEASAALFF
jgi:pyrroloquinoline quinone biosynthesis protein B